MSNNDIFTDDDDNFFSNDDDFFEPVTRNEFAKLREAQDNTIAFIRSLQRQMAVWIFITFVLCIGTTYAVLSVPVTSDDNITLPLQVQPLQVEPSQDSKK